MTARRIRRLPVAPGTKNEMNSAGNIHRTFSGRVSAANAAVADDRNSSSSFLCRTNRRKNSSSSVTSVTNIPSERNIGAKAISVGENIISSAAVTATRLFPENSSAA